MVIDATTKLMQGPRGDFYVWRFFPTYWPGSDIRTPASYRAHLQKYLTLDMDFHSAVARRLGIPRDEAKRRNFWQLYGGSAERYADQVLGIRRVKDKTFTVNFKEEQTMSKQKRNNFFVAPNTVGERYEGIGEGHPTLKDAVAHATKLTDSDGQERCVLQRVRVTRRKPQPVVVEKIRG
jgi:hypothetical protein